MIPSTTASLITTSPKLQNSPYNLSTNCHYHHPSTTLHFSALESPLLCSTQPYSHTVSLTLFLFPRFVSLEHTYPPASNITSLPKSHFFQILPHLLLTSQFAPVTIKTGILCSITQLWIPIHPYISILNTLSSSNPKAYVNPCTLLPPKPTCIPHTIQIIPYLPKFAMNKAILSQHSYHINLISFALTLFEFWATYSFNLSYSYWFISFF